MKNHKALILSDFKKIRFQFRNKKIILVSGCFDILHVGHIHFLESAKKKADQLIVGILSDKFVHLRKGREKPIFNQRDRLKVISSLEVVDYVFIFDKDNKTEVMANLRPNFYGIGGDRDLKEIPEKTYLDKYRVEIKRIPKYKSKSSSQIVKEIIDKA